LGSWPRNSDCRKPSLKAVLGRKKDEGNLTSKANSFHNPTEKKKQRHSFCTQRHLFMKSWNIFAKETYRNAELNIFEMRNTNARIPGAAT
jgi:hypothetical protein